MNVTHTPSLLDKDLPDTYLRDTQPVDIYRTLEGKILPPVCIKRHCVTCNATVEPHVFDKDSCIFQTTYYLDVTEEEG